MPDPAFAELAEWGGGPAQPQPLHTRHSVGIDPRRLLRLRLRMMIAIGAVTAVPAAIAVALLVPREYVAYADLEFKAEVPRIFADMGRPIIDPAYENFVNTQIKMIAGAPILGRVLENPAVNTLPSLQGADALKRLRGGIAAAPLPNTELVEVTASHVDREAALSILSAVVAEYMDFRRENEAASGSVRRETLLKSESDLLAQLTALQSSIVEKRRELGVPAGRQPGAEPTETESDRINLSNAEADLVAAQTAERQKRKDLERVRALGARNDGGGGPIYELGVENMVNQDPAVVALTSQLTAVQQELSVFQDRYVDTAPQLQLKRNERDALQERLDREKAKARRAALGSLVAQYEYDLTVVASNIAEAQERRDRFFGLLEEHREESLGLVSGMAEVTDLERELDSVRRNLDGVRDQIRTTDIESNAPARVRLVSPPSAPSSPSPARPLKALVLAWGACGALALALGVLQELRDQSIRSAEDIASVTDVPVIANVPHTTEDRLPAGTQPERVTAAFPSSMTADEFRRTVARVLYAPRGGRAIKSCLVASASRGDGKTTLACNIAIILAQADRRVLLVDADSRNASIERSFGLRPGPGLAEMLRGEPLQHDPDRVTQFPTLHVLGPGLNASDLVERLASKEMADFLDGAEELFDHIIIDTPASLLMAEARLLAPQVDGMIVVVGSNVSTFGMLRRCLDTMSEIGGNVLGIVMNGLRQTPGGYLRNNLDLFYREGRLPGPPPAGEPSIVLLKRRGGDADRA